MCTVQLPLSVTAAYVMRRVNRGQNRRSPAPDSVRRALFTDAIDHDLTARDLSTAFAEMQREATRRWNFDFSTDTPLQGRFEWYPVQSTENTIGESSITTTENTIDETPIVSTPVQETQSNQFSTSGKKTLTSDKSISKKPAQRKLTDFMTQRKRTSSMMSSKSPVVIAKSKVRKTLPIATANSTSTSTR